MSSYIKLNIGYDDGNTILQQGMAYNDGMSLAVGSLIEEGTTPLAPGGELLLVNNAGDFNYNSNGVFILIKNSGLSNKLMIMHSITAAEAAGGATYLRTGQLNQGELTWLNLAGVDQSGSSTSRAIKVMNNDSTDAVVNYAIFSRS